MIAAELLAMIVCPACRGKLEPAAKPESLRCLQCGNRYPIENDIPILITENAIVDPPAGRKPDA